jgi:hypothetical protein
MKYEDPYAPKPPVPPPPTLEERVTFLEGEVAKLRQLVMDRTDPRLWDTRGYGH